MDWDEALTIQRTSDGGYILGGYGYYYDFLLIKTDAEGNKEWKRSYGGDDIDIGYSAQQTNDGGYVIVGYSYTSQNFMQYLLIKTDDLGNEEWNQTYGDTGEDSPYDVKQTSDGGYIIVGSTNSYWEKDLWIVKTDEQGNMTWDITYGDDNLEYGCSVEQTIDNRYIIAGKKTDIDTSNSDFLLVRVDADSVMSVNDEITVNNYLSSYPNPFRTSTVINYSLPSNIRKATIEIYNIKGQLVKTLSFSSFLNPSLGTHEVVWDGKDDKGKDVGAGIYFYKLTAGNISTVKKLMLIK